MPSLIRNVSLAEIDGIDLANAVMDLLLRSVVNETTCEFGRINEFDTSYFAVLINLTGTILKIVPMKDMGWKNDGQGNRPKEFDEWVRELAEDLLKLITALIAAIGDFIAGLVEAAVEAGLKFTEMIAKAVMALIEAIVKAALLAFIFRICVVCCGDGFIFFNAFNVFILCDASLRRVVEFKRFIFRI